MRSGNGRHRRPRQAPAIFVTAGVTGAGIAIPLLGAGGAQAADTGTWDRVAQCESGGMWSADSGNGYYGGLQFTQETWEDYGGRDYAPRADLASRSQQISVAEKVLAEEGPEAWPSCATNAGLKEGGEAPDVDPGSTLLPGAVETLLPDAPESPESSESSSSADGATGTETSGPDEPDRADGESGTDRTEPSASPTQKSPESGSSDTPDASPGPGSGKHRGQPSEDEREGSAHASRGADPSRGEQSEDEDYTVRPGDSLSAIADEYGLPGGWSTLYDANDDVVGGDPDLIRPGQDLDLSAPTG
ncbi:transglycosylase family protein [Streptomyces sp. NPDC004647]|uniref:transglycosylase family protein n=1 Tax=Streptomyces sp. NPDC004647 TaxID=3154671 RepID=UPI0033B80FE4